MAKVTASLWTVRELFTGKRGQMLMRHPDVQAELLSAAIDLVADLTAALAPHSKTGTLAASVSEPKKGRGRSKYRYYIVIGKGVPYLLAFEHGRKTNGAYEGFHVIEGESQW